MKRLFALALALAASALQAAPGAHGPNGEHLDAAAAALPDGSSLARLPDGKVFVPVPAQRRMGLRTRFITLGTAAASLELPGRVVIDPAASGRVQPLQGGRIEPGPKGLPMAGQAVRRGEVLAYVRFAADPFAQAAQRAQWSELRAQRQLAEIAAKGESFVAVDLSYPMFDTKRDGKSLRTYWVPATRWISDFTAREPKLTLDIVPTGVVQGDTVEFRVALRGEPLPGVKMNAVVPSGWIKTTTSDIDGKFRFTLPWRGTYVIGTYHVEESSGVRSLPDKPDEAYELNGWNSSLSFHKQRGAAPFLVAEKTLPASVLAEMAKAKAAAQEAAAKK